MMGGWEMGVGGWIWMLLGLALIVAVVWLLAQGCQRPARSDEAVDILRRRLGRGEINEEEFEKTRRLLGD